MFNGLRKSKASKRPGPSTTNGLLHHNGPTGDLDKSLGEDAKTRKKKLSKMCFYQEKIRTRQAAETKLKASCGSAAKHSGTFLVRSSTACPNEFVLSFYFNDKILHYAIQYCGNQYKYCFENGPLFSGIDELIEHYQKTKDTKELPCCLDRPCPDSQPPPPLSLRAGYTNLLHKAVASGNEVEALKILAHPACPALDDRDEKGNTALHLACAGGGLYAVVEVLVEKGATVSAPDQRGYSALQLACQSNLASIARVLIVKGEACPHRRVPTTGNVPLHLAAERGHIETVQMLLSLDVPSCSRNFELKTPYELALANGHQRCADFIDDYRPPDPITNRQDWFHGSIKREDSIQLLGQQGCRDGLFLIRNSSQDPNVPVLDLCFERKKIHYKITEFMRMYYIGDGPLLPSLEHLVEYYCVFADGLATQLKYAVSPAGGTVSLEALSDGFHSKFAPDLPARGRPPAASEPMILCRDSITTTHELGQGEFGSVLKGVWKAPSGEMVPVAVKTLNAQHLVTGKTEFLREAQVMVQLDHPCIVKLIGICQEPELMLVQELLAMGSLLDFVLDYPEKVNMDVDIPVWASQIAFGMKYLEKQNLVHRDLAARNILLASKLQVKICDFGLSRAIGTNSNYYKAAHGGKWPVKWYAPESINYGTFSSASDVWGYGVTLWEMYTLGDQPYDEMTGAEVLQFIERKNRLQKPNACPVDMYTLMMRCWSYKPTDRPSFKQLYQELQNATNYMNVNVRK